MRILGLDFGTKTCGVAISDPLALTAQGLEIIRRDKPSHLRHTLQRIEEIIEEYGVELVVLGLPKNMNDTEGVRVEEISCAMRCRAEGPYPEVRAERKVRQYGRAMLQGYLDKRQYDL